MDYQEYRRRVWGCYTGKAVGGTLGMPFEGDLSTRRLTGYEPEPTEMLPNDDLDLQIIDLEIVRRYGLPVNRYHLSTMWNHLQDAGPDEYGAARWNVALGRPAPLSGYFCNKFYAGMGAAIRSELWACLAPGDPELAVRLAREDACTDHYNDGLHACVFLTAVESAAFVESDLHRLVEIGLRFLPEDCRLARGLRDSFSYWAETRDPYAARELLLRDYYVQNWTDVTINLCLILISWLASEGDFSRAICIAAGLGYDTDCTAATLGSILGIIHPEAIAERWLRPIGDRLVLSSSIQGLHEPETIGEFSDLVAATAAQALEYYGSTVRLRGLPEGEDALPPMHAPWTSDTHAADEMDGPHESLLAVTPLCARLIYPEEVSLAPKTEGVFRLALRNPCDQPLRGRFTLSVPEGWLVEPKSFDFAISPAQSEQFCFCVVPGEMAKRRARSNPIDFDFTLESGVRFSVTGDLPVTIPWLRTNLDTGKTEVVEAHAVFQAVPEGHYLYRTALKANVNMPVKLGAMSERALKVRMNGEELLVTDGSFYVPAYHRGKTTVDLTTIKGHGGWNQVEIEVLPGAPGELFFGLARPHNCCEWLQGAEYSLAPLG